jgi:CHAT domain-containing protein/tetratricopeptide (TPR) repeat protein
MNAGFRFLALLLASSVFPHYVCAATAALPEQATAIAELSPPKPSETVQQMLDEARRLADTKQPADSLKAADRALYAAGQTNDTAGAASAQQARAKALQDLQRTDEAVAAWQEAAQMWAAIGRAPGQINALVQAGLACVPSTKDEADKYFAQGLSIAKSDNQQPTAVSQALHDSGLALDANGQTQPAWDYLSAALAIREKQTPESLKLAETLISLAKLAAARAQKKTDAQFYSLERDYSARAADLALRLAPDSPLVVESLFRLGESELCLSEVAERQAPDSPLVAESLSRLGFSESIAASFATAREHYQAALRIQTKLAPGGSMEQEEILHDLGTLERDENNFPAATQYDQDALSISERLAPGSLQFKNDLTELGVLEMYEGELAPARDHLQRALGVANELHGNPASILLDLGDVASEQYDFAAARDYFERALALFIKYSPHAAGVPYALGNLATTYYRQGDLVSALAYSRRVIAIDEKKWPNSLNTADDLGWMGDILRAQGKFTAAATCYHRALRIKEKSDTDPSHISDSLVDLANLARTQHNRSLAMEYDRHAFELRQKSCPNLWCVVAILNDLGELAYEQGDLGSSEHYLRLAVDIREQSLGLTHPELARSLNDLALTVAAKGGTAEALGLALRAEKIGAEHLRTSVRTLSERQALAYAGVRASGLDLALTLAASRKTAPSMRTEVFDAVIHTRALIFDELAARRRSAYGSGDPQIKQLADQLLSARTRLATLVVRGVGDTTPETYRKQLDEARENKEQAERMLAEKSIAFREDQARAQVGLEDVAASLPQGAALVAFVRYARDELQTPGGTKVAREPVPAYAAFVLPAGGNSPEFVPLGPAREIESLLAAWRRDIAREAEMLDVSGKSNEDTSRRLGTALREKIWDPLIPRLGNAREVFVVPDAALHLVNLASLPRGNSEYVIETGPLIHYLSAERDLVSTSSHHGEGILVVGNPAFDQSGKVTLVANQQSSRAAPTLRGSRSACGRFRTLRFAPLPASQREADSIAVVWKKSNSGEGTAIGTTTVQPGSDGLLQLTGAAASPEAFEQYAPGKRVLHVATHGFFLEGSCSSAMQRQADANVRDDASIPATVENPLLLSGLAFAGANRRASATSDETDGILTAEEIAGINLEGVDWAVLSACDTGVGEIKVGEGVFGLRRAFQLAGAKTVIMSLWRVEDETARQWMGTLYREHFLNGKDTGESARAASLQILRQRRAKHESTHPFYWGAFIAAGEWH